MEEVISQREELRRWRERNGVVNTARETAYQYIRGKILDLEYFPGMSLNDKNLAEELNMSRTPVREALILLNAANMVVVKPQSGTYVAPINMNWLELEQFNRFAIEKEVVTKACGKITPEIEAMYTENLEEYNRLFTEAVIPDKEKMLLEVDNRFHRIAYIATEKQDVYYYMLDSLQHVERFRVLSLRRPVVPTLSWEHEMICKAIMEGNESSALHHLEEHMERYRTETESLKREFPEFFAAK